MIATSRHRTAISRSGLSRPVRLVQSDGLIEQESTFFDYGCGRGGDVQHLARSGVEADGWDPNFRPNVQVRSAHVVNLGYVINVIENPVERREVLERAWGLADRVLVVAARLTDEKDVSKLSPFADGWMTGRNTFQKFYDQVELRNYVDSVLGAEAVAAGPGVFYVFRDEALKQGFLARRSRQRRVAVPRRRISDELYEQHQEILAPLVDFFTQRGRLPQPDELPVAPDLADAFGSIKRAFRVVLIATGDAEWEEIRRRRREDLLVYLGLSNFGGRPRSRQLPPDVQLDIRAFFSSYKMACESADRLLFAAGDMERINLAVRVAGVGKLMPSALYVHETAVDDLPPLLRVYEGCARRFIGEIEEANIVKLSREEPKVSYLSYPDFDRDPHPALASSVVVPLQTFWVKYRGYSREPNPPILHRKEVFVSHDYPGREKFARLTAAEERAGLLGADCAGRRVDWCTQVTSRGFRFKGHRLVVMSQPADQLL